MSTLRLLSLQIRLEHDVVLCRQRARQFATHLGFDTQDQVRIATAVSEIARNAFEYANGGRIEFAVETERASLPPRKGQPAQTLVVTVRDQGPGLPPPEQRHSPRGLGLGLTGAQRLVDAMEITSQPGATAIVLRKVFPAGVPVLSAPQLQAVVDRITAEPPGNPLAELQRQNQDLIRSMEEVRERQEEVARVNQELADTNAGVLALYDELETLHRVGEVLAAQLDLKTLLQAIIDATTDLTEASIGAFFYREEAGGTWRLRAVAGSDREMLTGVSIPYDADFPRPELEMAAKFMELFRGTVDLKSCLVIPVDGESETMGAMIFASTQASAFSERSERIVSSIAAQAVIGITKARLFDKVQSASAAKDRFLAMLSHELRTPLNPVLAVVTEWTSNESFPAEIREELAVVLRNVRLEARLIDDLLDFSRIVSGKLLLHREPLDLHALIRNVVVICAEDTIAGAQTVTLELEAGRTEMLGDAARLQQVLWNVLKNAIKFTPTGGKITVRTSQTDETMVTVTVMDNGVGIDPAALPGIFDAFEQGGTETTVRFGGLGLGLAITKAFVELHGGKIRIHSAGRDLGAQIAIDLPLLQQQDTSRSSPPAPVPPAVPKPPTGTLLLVDDHVDTLKVMSRLLTRRGYQVLSATDCRSALEVARRHPFDLIVSDLGLPDGSGLTLLGQLRHIRNVPAVALSGYGMEEDVSQSRLAGYDEHLTKPIDFPLLLLSVERLLARAKS